MKMCRLIGLGCFAGILLGASPAISDSGKSGISEAEAQSASQSIVNYCKILIKRMDGAVTDNWATQDLRDLAAAWQSLGCDKIFGIEERARWLAR